MRPLFIFIFFFFRLSSVVFGQQLNTNLSTADLTKDMRILVETNKNSRSGLDLSTIEAISLNKAPVNLLIQVLKPYLNSDIPNAKYLCQNLLTHSLYYQVKNNVEKKKVLEIICVNFLDKENILFLNNILDILNEKDFTYTAKVYVTRLIDYLPSQNDGLLAKFLSVAQIKQSIPALWKIADTNFQTMQHRDIDILVSLARMKQKKAAILLSEYYTSDFNKWGNLSDKKGEFWRHFVIAKRLVYSLDSIVLATLIKEFNTIDLDYSFRDGDTGFYPAQYLGSCIANMIKNYPFDKQDYLFKPNQLFEWLKNNHIELEDR